MEESTSRKSLRIARNSPADRSRPSASGSGNADSRVGLEKTADAPTFYPSHQLTRPICRAIVDEDQLPLLKGLVEHGSHGSPEQLRSVVHGNDDTDHVVEGPLTHSPRFILHLFAFRRTGFLDSGKRHCL